MNNKLQEYGVIQRNVIVRDLTKIKGPNERTAFLGNIVKITAVLANNNFAIRFAKDDQSWETTTFCCPQNEVICVYDKFWPYLAAVSSSIERVKLASDRARCDRLMQIGKDSVVIFTDSNKDYLGTVKFVGNVKGIGLCFGIKLHEKKPNNRCDGLCAGIQYFTCLPGYGVFTTVEKIRPQNMPPLSNNKENKTQFDTYIEKNISSIGVNTNSCNNKNGTEQKYEEIITRYQEYPKITPPENLKTTRNSSYFRHSLSLQNILDINETPNVNTTNDFDQNTIIQPDNTHLIQEQNKHLLHNNKSTTEIDLIDTIGGCWSGTTDQKQLDSFSNLRKSLIKNDLAENTNKSTNNSAKTPRNRSLNPLSHLMDASKTLPKKTKLLTENINKNQDANTTNKNEDTTLKINERSEIGGRSNSPVRTSPSTSQKIVYYEPEVGTTDDFTIGSLVEVLNDVTKDPLYGVIRWMGVEANTKFILVGIELEEEHTGLPLTLTDGTHNGERFFECAENRALFVPLKQCHKDSRFQDGTPTPVHQVTEKVFEKVDCPVIQGSVPPLCMPTEEDVEAVCGKFRGIQGHHNSCYLDVTLFSMFTYTAVFDSLLFRPKGPNDIADYEEVQRVLREEIVNPLRKNLFVRADRVMNLRKLLDRLSNVPGLTCEEKDPEEFLNSLLAQILKAEPFLKLNSGQEAYHYQLFVEKDDHLTLPSVQQLFEQSFLSSDIKLKEVPSCLIIQMPRFGKNFKMYPRILPSQLLDVTDIIENSPRQCTVCGKLAKWECKQCFGECGVGLESTAFCKSCLETAHSHIRRSSHSPRHLTVSNDYSIMENHCSPPRLFMELFAVICIETSHYVAFVKCGVGHEAPWCFFDSMADRKGEKNGYNIPEMVACPDVSKWLSDEQSCRRLSDSNPLDRYLPEHARRLLCDAYICMYQSPDVMMYR